VPELVSTVELAISGQKSGYMEGYYYSLRPARVHHKLIDGEKVLITTIEHSVQSKGDNGRFFSKPGDSGSLVYTVNGHVVVGLLFAGELDPPWTSCFTHIDDVIADIKCTTGVAEVQLWKG
jgi:hypothetical protein